MSRSSILTPSCWAAGSSRPFRVSSRSWPRAFPSGRRFWPAGFASSVRAWGTGAGWWVRPPSHRRGPPPRPPPKRVAPAKPALERRIYSPSAMTDYGRRLDLALATALSVITILSRLPYRARMLYDWDAVQFALALREFDVAKHQPHPPGYILYVALGRLVNAWVGEPTATYVLLAVVFSGLTTFVV